MSDDSYTSKDAVELCKPVFQQLECVKWRSNLWNDQINVNGNKLRTYREFKTKLKAEAYLNLNISRHYRSSFSKLRCGVLPLEIETGRYSRTELAHRICKLCDSNAIESEVHFLIQCPLYVDQRQRMLDQALEQDDDFNL